MWPLDVRSTGGRTSHRVGLHDSVSGAANYHLIKAFEERPAESRHRNGENVVIEYRFATARWNARAAADLVRLVSGPIGTQQYATVAAMKATTTIPLVMANSADSGSVPGLSPLWRGRAGTSRVHHGHWRRAPRQRLSC